MTTRKKAEGFPPADGTKRQRRVRNEVVPGFPMHRLGARAMLFAEADIPTLAHTAGLQLVAGTNVRNLAAALDTAFTMALSWNTLHVREPASHALHDFLATIERQAGELLGTLGVPHDARPGEPDVSTQNWLLHVQSGTHGPNSPMFWQRTGDDRYRDYLREIALNETSWLQPIAGVADRRAAMSAAANSAILAGVPTMLRTLAAAAAAARELASHAPKRVGRRENLFNQNLFAALHRLHRVMFGVDPSIETDVEHGRLGPGVNWARHILSLAAERIEAVLSDPDTAAVVTVRSAANLSDSRIADLLAKGRRRLPQKPAK